MIFFRGPQVSLLQNTESPIPLLRHSSTIGLPLYWWQLYQWTYSVNNGHICLFCWNPQVRLNLLTMRWDAVGQHDPPYSHEEELRVVEVKKKDPPAADEVKFPFLQSFYWFSDKTALIPLKQLSLDKTLKVHPRIYVGNKAAAESVPFLASLGEIFDHHDFLLSLSLCPVYLTIAHIDNTLKSQHLFCQASPMCSTWPQTNKECKS